MYLVNIKNERFGNKKKHAKSIRSSSILRVNSKKIYLNKGGVGSGGISVTAVSGMESPSYRNLFKRKKKVKQYSKIRKNQSRPTSSNRKTMIKSNSEKLFLRSKSRQKK